ncbi:MAG: MFS transporter [Culicoidibacterales bacterium]
MNLSKKHASLIVIWVIYLSFVALGLPDTGFGVAWNAIWPEFGVQLSDAGIVTVTITIASILSGLLANRLLNRFGTGLTTVFSCLLTGFATLGFVISPNFFSFLLFAFPLGFGAGAVDTGLNAYVAEHLSAKHMNWLHGAWGLGATFSPMILTATIIASNWRVGYLGIGIILVIVSLIVWLSLPLWHSLKRHQPAVEAATLQLPHRSRLTVGLAILSFVLYVAVEAGLGLWLSALLLESRGATIGLAGGMVSVYFGALTLGRFVFGSFAEHLGNRKAIRIGLTIASLGAFAFWQQTSLALASVGILALGFGFAPIYPSLMHETMHRFPKAQAQKVIGQQVAFSYVSILFFVPLFGILATITFLEIIPLFALAIIFSLWLVIVSLDALTLPN